MTKTNTDHAPSAQKTTLTVRRPKVGRKRMPVSPYTAFTREEWALLRADTAMSLDEADLDRLAGINIQLSMEEVIDIYLPMSRLLHLYVAAAQQLHAATNAFLGRVNGERKKTPYIIGLAGSVAVGKSTTARVLQALLARWPGHPRVDLVTTDGFLHPNRVLEERGIMNRKGFPESYDAPLLLKFLDDVKSGRARVEAPVYSHFSYDILPGERITVDRPDILIVEGLNVLQPATLPRDGTAIPFVSDYFDFSIYIDADAGVIGDWYVERFMRLRDTAFQDPDAYFHRYAQLDEAAARDTAQTLWDTINLVNLRDNILPTRQRADLILTKGDDHGTMAVHLRKL